MFAFRSLSLGLLGACCLLMAMRPPITVVESEPGKILVVSSPSMVACPIASPGESPVTVVDVAPGVTADQLASLIVLSPGERIATVDDAPVGNGTVALASLDLRARKYIDLSIDSVRDARARRVLVLLR